MKHKENTPLQDDASFTEIEYTPIRRKSKEGRSVRVTSDEISVLPTQHEQILPSSADAPMEYAVPELTEEPTTSEEPIQTVAEEEITITEPMTEEETLPVPEEGSSFEPTVVTEEILPTAEVL